MPQNSGPAGAEKIVAEYEKAYLLEMRAGIVQDDSLSIKKRLLDYEQRLAPEVRKWIANLPEAETPQTLVDMRRLIRKWAETERVGMPHNKRQQVAAIKDKEKRTKKRRIE